MVLQLNKKTEDGTLLEKMTVYQRANKQVKSVTLDKKNTCIITTMLESNMFLVDYAGRYYL